MNAFILSCKSALGSRKKTLNWFLLVTVFTFVSIVGFYVTDMATQYETEIRAEFSAVEELVYGKEHAENITAEDVEKAAWGYSDVANMLMKISDAMFWGIYITMLVVVLFMAVVWVRDHGSDIGIYIILGKSRLRIIAQLLLEMAIVSLTVMIPATVIGLSITNKFGARLLLMLRERLGYQYYMTMQEMDETMLYTKLSAQTVIKSDLLVLALLLAVVTILGLIAVYSRTSCLFEQEN